MREQHEGLWASSTYKKMCCGMLIFTSRGREAFINKNILEVELQIFKMRAAPLLPVTATSSHHKQN